jgi:hypothetical protein
MALSVVKVQDSRAEYSVGLQQESFLLIPGTSDYVTGGYPVTTTLTGFKNIQLASIDGENATALGWDAYCVFPLAQVGTGGPGFGGYLQFLFYLAVVTTGVQAANGANISGAIWVVTIQGY